MGQTFEVNCSDTVHLVEQPAGYEFTGFHLENPNLALLKRVGSAKVVKFCIHCGKVISAIHEYDKTLPFVRIRSSMALYLPTGTSTIAPSALRRTSVRIQNSVTIVQTGSE